MKARRFGVIGDPVAHSRSPALHAAAYRALGLPHRYEAVRVTAQELPAVVGQLRRGDFDGLNVTVPHKESILRLVDAPDDIVLAVGAANTLVRGDDGRIAAHNTDAPALAAELRRIAGTTLPWGDVRALVLGSGGAARAAVAALATLGVRDIAVRARAFSNDDAARAFVASLPCAVTTQVWEPSPESELRTQVLVQATSAGMHGADPGEAVAAAVAWDAVPPEALAIDVVYAPRDTPWLRAARRRGLRSDGGLGMLARQGALAFELWLGIDAPLEAMRAAL
jgi:shikimate dehydrogenase